MTYFFTSIGTGCESKKLSGGRIRVSIVLAEYRVDQSEKKVSILSRIRSIEIRLRIAPNMRLSLHPNRATETNAKGHRKICKWYLETINDPWWEIDSVKFWQKLDSNWGYFIWKPRTRNNSKLIKWERNWPSDTITTKKAIQSYVKFSKFYHRIVFSCGRWSYRALNCLKPPSKRNSMVIANF